MTSIMAATATATRMAFVCILGSLVISHTGASCPSISCMLNNILGSLRALYFQGFGPYCEYVYTSENALIECMTKEGCNYSDYRAEVGEVFQIVNPIYCEASDCNLYQTAECHQDWLSSLEVITPPTDSNTTARYLDTLVNKVFSNKTAFCSASNTVDGDMVEACMNMKYQATENSCLNNQQVNSLILQIIGQPVKDVVKHTFTKPDFYTLTKMDICSEECDDIISHYEKVRRCASDNIMDVHSVTFKGVSVLGPEKDKTKECRALNTLATCVREPLQKCKGMEKLLTNTIGMEAFEECSIVL